MRLISDFKISIRACWTPLKHRRAWLHLSAALCVFAFAIVGAAYGTAKKGKGPPQNQLEEYNAEAPKTILELQQFRQTTSIPIQSQEGREGTATLVNLNPAINVWYLLKVTWKIRSRRFGDSSWTRHIPRGL